MTNRDDTAPTLPAELAELVLLHLPAILTANRSQGKPTLSIAEWTHWVYCILPSGMPASSARQAARMFVDASALDAWEPLITARGRGGHKRLPASKVIEFATLWHRAVDRAEHMYAAFDCAVVYNRVKVLDLWINSAELPQRTGVLPQPELPLVRALKRHSFQAVGWIHDHVQGDFEPARAVADFAVNLCYDNDKADTIEALIEAMGGRAEFDRIVGYNAQCYMLEAAIEMHAGDIFDML